MAGSVIGASVASSTVAVTATAKCTSEYVDSSRASVTWTVGGAAGTSVTVTASC